MKQTKGVAVWAALSIIFWIINYYFPNQYIENTFYTFVVLTIIHISFKVVLDNQFSKKIKEKRTRYSFRKITSILYLGCFIASVVIIWSGDAQEITVALGLVGAGMAFALQDVLKNLAGGVIIYLNRLYVVGDRIEINSKIGDVIDIGILYTTILEIREWITTDSPTGRITSIPNGLIISNDINNYTKDHNYVWDEITIPLDYKSDVKYAQDKILNMVTELTSNYANDAKKSIEKMGEKYYLGDANTQPVIFKSLNDKEIVFKIRYSVETRHRANIKDKISELILEEIKNSPDKISITTQTLNITEFPDISIKEKQK
ncbi:MAG: mechanosensitive ion channel [Nitrosopumilaceae archaeon]|jgi:small-conductance mechanosensitive channel